MISGIYAFLSFLSSPFLPFLFVSLPFLSFPFFSFLFFSFLSLFFLFSFLFFSFLFFSFLSLFFLFSFFFFSILFFSFLLYSFLFFHFLSQFQILFPRRFIFVIWLVRVFPFWIRASFVVLRMVPLSLLFFFFLSFFLSFFLLFSFLPLPFLLFGQVHDFFIRSSSSSLPFPHCECCFVVFLFFLLPLFQKEEKGGKEKSFIWGLVVPHPVCGALFLSCIFEM